MGRLSSWDWDFIYPKEQLCTLLWILGFSPSLLPSLEFYGLDMALWRDGVFSTWHHRISVFFPVFHLFFSKLGRFLDISTIFAFNCWELAQDKSRMSRT